jgi:HD-GYP domain-containing protein (c-di-GMP phosphodiesterase class II)
VGNAALRAVAELLREGLRGCDSIGRLGGEEFGIVLPEAVAADAVVVAERLRLSVRESLSVPGLRGHVLTVSVGVADSEDARATGAAQLVDLADRTLYLAKRRGRDRVIRADELDDGPDWTLEIRGDEIEALRRRLAVLSARAKDVYVQSVASLLQALNEKDPYTAHHALNVAFYAQQMAEEHGCSAGTVRGIYNAALLHDIGKVGVPDRILMKATSLDRTERMVIEQVPSIGTRIVDHLRILEAEVQIIRHQHEYFDGGGRPAGLAGGRIPIGSRILLAADAFDAMTTDRIYRHRRSMDEAVAELDRLAGTQFDPRVVRSLHQILERNRPLWQQRIDDTVRAMQLPTDVVLGTASGL